MWLDDIDFADHQVLLSHMPEQIRDKTTSEAVFSALIGFNIRKGNGLTLKHNMEDTNIATFNGETLEEVETLT
ncbi:unnamed protein product [Schistosoma margrebowiei]|uniref:Uncharacterized protein n=1 Tax=Schistosoma margrebowiei TaxID=48269 RepID=A0A183MTA7_9TREM|nr:unnamed protein product [Schistosoma margrebowiei]